jgi:transposase
MRGKITVLQDVLTGRFDEHHAQICRMMLSTIDTLTAQIEELTGSIEQAIAPLARQVEQLDEVSAIRRICAQDIIAEIGVDIRDRRGT